MNISCFKACAMGTTLFCTCYSAVAKQPSPRELLSLDVNLISVYYSVFLCVYFKIKVISIYISAFLKCEQKFLAGGKLKEEMCKEEAAEIHSSVM